MALPQVVVEIGFSGPGDTSPYLHLDDPVSGVLDTALLAPADLWVDVSTYVRSWQTRRGATRVDGPLLRYEAGTATIVLKNADRRFDPTNLDGPYVAGGVTQVEPMRPVRIRAVWDDLTYDLWRGYADGWKVTYPAPTWSEVTLTATDAFKIFSSHDRDEAAPIGAGEDTGARINRILDSVSWPAVDRIVATGQTTVQATTLAANALTELHLTADTELGELYMDGAGNVVFRDRHGVLVDERSTTSQATFGDEVGEMPYADAEITYDDDAIYNLISIARTGGTAQTVEDTASRAAYLTRSFSRTDLLMETDGEALAYAQVLLSQTARPELRFGRMDLRPLRDQAMWPHALGREIGDRITVIRRPPGGGDPIDRDVLVRGVEHQSNGEDWSTRWVLQSTTRYHVLVLDHPEWGQLDTYALGY